MGTTHSVEELERLGAYGSHKRPRTLSRGSSAEGRNVVVRPRPGVLEVQEKKASSNGYSTGVEQQYRYDDSGTEPPSAVASAGPQTEAGEAEDEEADPNAELRPVAVALMRTPLPYRSRQRPRHPETKPPPPDELRRLMDQSKAMKEELEAEESAELGIVDAPHENDVLLGRGRRCTEHHGNILFREFVRERRDEYNMSWKYKKQEMAVEIVEKIKALDPPGRFLELLNDGKWREVTKKQCLEKASQAMREKKWNAEHQANSAAAPGRARKVVEPDTYVLSASPPQHATSAVHAEDKIAPSEISSTQLDATLERSVLHDCDGTNTSLQGSSSTTFNDGYPPGTTDP